MIDPNNINIYEAVGAIVGAWFMGWAVGFFLWLVRYLFLELPRTGNILKGGEQL